MSNYPGNLDTDLELPRIDDGITEINGDVVNAIRDAVVAIEKALGADITGNKSNLNVRISQVIDSDGVIKPSALSTAGLVTSPLDNSDVDTNANIEESKLDLDYSTSFLQGRISSISTTANANSSTINSINQIAGKHYNGTTNRHDGYQIDLDDNIRSTTTVEAALHVIDNNLGVAESNITNITGRVENLEAEVDALEDPVVINTQHQDHLHSSSILLQTKGSSVQGGDSTATLACATYKTDTSSAANILQVLRPNVARVTGLAPDLGGLDVSTVYQLRIQAGGVSRGALDVDLSSALPVDDVDDIVDRINTVAHSDANHYPVTAYNVGDRLVVAHNIPGENYTIQILSSISNSAHSVLGFSDVVDNTFEWTDGYNGVHVGGLVLTDAKPLLNIRYSHSTPLDEIHPDMGNILGLFDVDTNDEARLLCNITNHSSDDTANGTYYITDILGDNGFRLNTNVIAGEFDIEIPASSVAFEDGTTARGELWDVFFEPILEEDGYDGYGRAIKVSRAEYLTNTGASITALSQDFPTSGMSWRFDSNSSIVVSDASDDGVEVDIPSGYRGQVEVYAPDNVNSAIIQVTSNLSDSGSKSISPLNTFAGEENRVYLATVHFAGDYGDKVLGYITDRRRIANSSDTIDYDIQSPLDLAASLDGLRNNGVIRGFDVISNTSTTIKVRGGKAVVAGKILDVETQSVTIDSFTGAKRLLTLNEYGIYKVYDEDEAGYTIAELTDEDGYGDERRLATIVEFGTTGSALDNTFTDRRLLIGNIDKRLINQTQTLTTRMDNIEGALNGYLWGNTEMAGTKFNPSYISVTLDSNNNSQTVEFNPFNTVASGGTTTTNDSKNIVFSSGLFTAQSSGVYKIDIVAYINHSAIASLDTFRVWKNQTTTVWSGITIVHSAIDPTERSISFITPLSAGDYLELRINSSSTDTAQCVIGTTFNMVKIDSDDDDVAQITTTANTGFNNLDDAGFTSGTDTARRFEFYGLEQESLIKSKGLTHVNVLLRAAYADEGGSNPFGTSGTATIDIGALITTGIANNTTDEEYITVKTIDNTQLPSNTVTEQYVVSIPISLFSNISSGTVIFDIVPRVRITGSEFVDGGGGGTQPILTFDRVRVVTSSYSIVGDLTGQDGTDTALATSVGDVL